MERCGLLLLLCGLLAACCQGAGAAPEATALSRTQAASLYVAINGDDRWSGGLPAPDAERTNGPFATLERAQEAARNLLQRQMPVLVQVRGGTYYLERPLRFGPADSGTARVPMVYEAYPGEEPVLSGGRPVSGWRETTPGVWQATVPDVASGAWRFSQLYVNDRRCARPVWPEEGYSLIEAEYCPVFGALHDSFLFRDGDLRADWYALGDVEIIPVHAWTISRLPIQSVDAQTRLVRLTGTAPNASWSALNAGRWYRAENVREALKRPGQFYLDRAAGTLTYLPRPDENMAAAKVVAPRLETVIEFDGDPRLGLYAENLILRGLTIAHSAWNTPANGFRSGQADSEVGAAVTARNARSCALERCVVRQTGGYAVEFGAGCDSMRVDGCELYDLGDGGVKIGTWRYPDEPDPSQWAARCTVRDTLIAHGGRFLPAGVGVLVGHAAENLVEYNDIADLYYSGISVGWRWHQGFSPAHHNTIRNNHIRDIGQGVLGDMAGIYCLGESPGTTLTGNVIHDVNRHTYGGWGIYFDAECRGIVAEGNLVYRTQDSGLHQNYARDNAVRNNIFAFGGNGQYRFSDASRSGAMLLERNVFYAGDGPLIEENYGPDQEFTFKDNLYWRAAGADALRFPGGQTFEPWRQEREPGALLADPLFVAPAKGDFTLLPGSPALAAGFRPLDAAQAGRRTRLGRVTSLPPVDPTWPPAPGPKLRDLPTVTAIHEDFEAFIPFQTPTGWGSWSNPPGSVVVSAETAGSGRQSLRFQDGDYETEWQPHVFKTLAVEQGVVHCRFKLRLEAGARMIWEWRDYAPTLVAGPRLSVDANGLLKANDRELLRLPMGQWVELTMTCRIGKAEAPTYDVQVRLPGGNEAQVHAGIAYSEAFHHLDWVGFISPGSVPGVFYVDDVDLVVADER